MSTTATHQYDYVVLGGGSGGIASAKRAATYGKKVAVIEQARLGGTCVNVGCVPKKIMWSAATMADTFKHDAQQYCFTMPNNESFDNVQFDWSRMKKKRDAYIVKLNNIYGNGLDKAGVDYYPGKASFVDRNTIQIQQSNGTTTILKTQHTLIATGGRPHVPTEPGVEEYTISSDGFFEMQQLPKTVVVVGAGYIAVELAGVLNSLGSKTHLVVRKHCALRNFDPDISAALDDEMQKAGILIHRNTAGVQEISLDEQRNTKTISLINGEVIEGADIVIMAPGRLPNTEGLNLQSVGVDLNHKGFIQVDEYQNTSAEHIFALGDVCGHVELTPMAIAAGRRLSDRIFGGMTHAKVSYEEVPTVVFSHPTIGCIGLTEPQAIEKYGAENLKIYRSKFANLYYGIFDSDESKSKTTMKLITAGVNERVVGVHVIGMGADEMLQGVGIAIKMGATKADFDSTIAIHPTAAEELVTMGAWGTSPQVSGAVHSPLMGAPPAEPTLSKM